MQSNMLLNQRSNQHFKLSKSSLIKKNVKHIDPKHTHIHTHTKHVQPILYFKNKLRQFSKHTFTQVFLVMTKSHCTCTYIKSSKEYCMLCVRKTLQDCISIYML